MSCFFALRDATQHRCSDARYSSIYSSTSWSHLLIAALPNANISELTLACLNVPETNNMISNMTSWEAAMSPELN